MIPPAITFCAKTEQSYWKNVSGASNSDMVATQCGSDDIPTVLHCIQVKLYIDEVLVFRLYPCFLSVLR